MRQKIIYIISALILVGGFFFWRISQGVSNENFNIRGVMTERLHYIPGANSNSDKYISELEAQIKDNPSNSSLYNMLGGAYLQKARETSDPLFYTQAEEKLKRAIELDGKN